MLGPVELLPLYVFGGLYAPAPLLMCFLVLPLQLRAKDNIDSVRRCSGKAGNHAQLLKNNTCYYSQQLGCVISSFFLAILVLLLRNLALYFDNLF